MPQLNLYEAEHFFLFHELQKLEVENSSLMSTMPQPPDTGHVCSVTGVHFPRGSVIHLDVLDTHPSVCPIVSECSIHREKLCSNSLMTFELKFEICL